jgi:DNA polymerase III delta subunit
MEKKDSHNVVLLSGNFYQRQRVLDKIKNSLGSYELSIFNNDYSYDYVEQSILENSMFPGHKLYIINEWPQSKMSRPTMITHFKKMLSSFAADPDFKEKVVVLNNLDFSGDGLIKHVAQFGLTYAFEQTVTKYRASEWIRASLKEAEKNIEDYLSDIAVEAVTTTDKVNLDKVFLLVNKLIDYTGTRKKITEDDVMQVCSQSDDFVIWNLFNKLDDKNASECISFINKLAANAKFEDLVEGILHGMYRKYKSLIFLSDCVRQKKNQKEMTEEISKLLKLVKKGLDSRITFDHKRDERGNIEDTPIYSAKEIAVVLNGFYGKKASVSCYKTDELLNIIELIGLAQMRIREGCTSSEYAIVLEMLCLSICGAVDIKYIKNVLKSPEMLMLES